VVHGIASYVGFEHGICWSTTPRETLDSQSKIEYEWLVYSSHLTIAVLGKIHIQIGTGLEARDSSTVPANTLLRFANRYNRFNVERTSSFWIGCLHFFFAHSFPMVVGTPLQSGLIAIVLFVLILVAWCQHTV
jgi:hypothetical protein